MKTNQHSLTTANNTSNGEAIAGLAIVGLGLLTASINAYTKHKAAKQREEEESARATREWVGHGLSLISFLGGGNE
jgi:hypothetical protein